MSGKERILEEVYRKGYEFESKNQGCGQCTVAALQECFDIDDCLFKSASSFVGGISSANKGYCGAFNGGTLVLNYFFGREKSDFKKPEMMDRARNLTLAFKDRFVEKYGGLMCEQVQTKIMGRSYVTSDPEQKKQFVAAGAYDDKCTAVVGTAASLVAEILLDNGVPAREGE